MDCVPAVRVHQDYEFEAYRLRDLLIRCLQACRQVAAIACFGSTATGRVDRHSDVDMIVCVSDRVEWIVDSGLFLRTRYYRPFGRGGVKPDGRYWFEGFSVFSKLDISFHDSVEYADLLRDGDPRRYITLPIEELWSRGLDGNLSSRVFGSRASGFTKEELLIGRWVYKSIRAIADYGRGNAGFDLTCSTLDELADIWSRHEGSDWIGGDLDSVVKEVLSLRPD